MNLFGPVTNTECAGWQRRAARGLVELLDAAAKADLPVLTWQVSSTRPLVGRCLNLDMPARQRAFQRWCDFLGEVDQWPAHGGHGTTHLHATRRRWGRERVDVTVLADIHADDSPDADTDEA